MSGSAFLLGLRIMKERGGGTVKGGIVQMALCFCACVALHFGVPR